MPASTKAVLVLEDGTRYVGRAYGALGRTLGEAVFATGMTGYQETLTDPSYAGQIVMMTAPHIGNTGMNDDDMESRQIWVSGFVVRDPSRVVSNFRAQRSLDADLESGGVVGISDIDTRAVTRHIRSAGAMRAGIFSGDDFGINAFEQLSLVRDQAGMAGRNLSAEVSTPEPFTMQPTTERIGSVAVLDLGVKKSTLDYLAARGFEVHVLPQMINERFLLDLAPDALFYSNGPGDPAASDTHVELLRTALRAGIPYFGICFGNQLLGRALGFETYKLPFGHRGINQPVLDKTTGRVEITSQNHGFAVDAPIDRVVDSPAGFGRVEVSHFSLNDQVVEGLNCLDVKAFSVQYHPEAAAGPHDANYLFDRFRELVSGQSATMAKPARSEVWAGASNVAVAAVGASETAASDHAGTAASDDVDGGAHDASPSQPDQDVPTQADAAETRPDDDLSRWAPRWDPEPVTPAAHDAADARADEGANPEPDANPDVDAETDESAISNPDVDAETDESAIPNPDADADAEPQSSDHNDTTSDTTIEGSEN